MPTAQLYYIGTLYWKSNYNDQPSAEGHNVLIVKQVVHDANIWLKKWFHKHFGNSNLTHKLQCSLIKQLCV